MNDICTDAVIILTFPTHVHFSDPQSVCDSHDMPEVWKYVNLNFCCFVQSTTKDFHPTWYNWTMDELRLILDFM